MTSSLKRWARLSGLVAVFATLAVVFTGVGPANAATLTNDNFEDGNTSGWTNTGGTWIVNSDGSNKVLRQSSFVEGALARVGYASWRDYTIRAAVRPESFNGLPGSAGVVARASSTTNYYAFVLNANDTVTLTRTSNGTTQVLAKASYTVDFDKWYTLSLNVKGQKLTGTIGSTTIRATDGFLTSGPGGLTTTWANASFDNVYIYN